MPGLVETFAAALGWKVSQANVIVEGTSDVAIMWLAAAHYHERHRIPILGDKIAILPAGRGNEGGVDGLNRRLNAVRQIADADRGPQGELRYRFIGLYDNDRAGRRAIDDACRFDRRLLRYGDLFLLRPIMPMANGADHSVLRRRFEVENSLFDQLDWEIEDLLSERILLAFEDVYPSAITDEHEVGGRKHREFTRDGKQEFVKFLQSNAILEDLMDVVRLIRSLRDYLRVQADHIVC